MLEPIHRSAHFPLITYEEYNELRIASAIGEVQDIIPQRAPRLIHTKVFKGNKEKALEFTKNYLNSLELALEIK